MSTVAEEVARFDRTVPIESSVTPPSSWYTRGDILSHEKQTVFQGTWQAVGRIEQVSKSGDFFAGRFMGEPYLVVRGDDGVLRAFYNVCRHHAARLVDGEGCTAQLVCPYHGWTYRLDGALKSAPRLGPARDFRREEFGLKPLPVATWGPFVFICFGEPRRSIDAELAPLAALRSPEELAGLKFVCRRTYELRCNWKVYVDNYLDGGYHVEIAHQSLAGQLDLDSYRTEVIGRTVLQTSSAAPDDGSDAQARLKGGAVYAWIYPNLMINRYGPMMDTNFVVPLGPERCLTIFDYYFENPDDQEFVDKSLAASHQVQLEDVELCESVQAGLESSGYDVGRYAPVLEVGEYAFHCWLAEDMERV